VTTLTSGDNHVSITCIRQRRIEGVVRIPRSESGGPVFVRCPGGEERPVSGTRLFQLRCDADATAVEYQLAEEGPWRSVPIAKASEEDTPFVDIAPL
jgi:hypothetical protein